MHLKRKGPKSTRAGCLMCKRHKRQGALPRHRDMKFGNYRKSESQRDQLNEAGRPEFGRDDKGSD